jgi:hypothetical protein
MMRHSFICRLNIPARIQEFMLAQIQEFGLAQNNIRNAATNQRLAHEVGCVLVTHRLGDVT